MTYRECYDAAVLQLEAAGVPEAKLDARLLLEHVCRTDYNTLLVHGDRTVTSEEEAVLGQLLEQRKKRIPLQQLTGEQDFCGLTFKVNEHVLIPRQDTEILVEAALKKSRSGMHLLDMCTGSGCILISLLSMGKDLTGVGVDISKEALAVARENAMQLLAEEKQPEFLQGDLFTAFDTWQSEAEPQQCETKSGRQSQFDIVVSNPPYIESAVIETLMPEVKEYEPRTALDGSEDGLLFYRRIVAECMPYLKENGYLMFEIGCNQAEAVSSLMSADFTDIEVIKDYAGLDRVVLGRRCASE